MKYNNILPTDITIGLYIIVHNYVGVVTYRYIRRFDNKYNVYVKINNILTNEPYDIVLDDSTNVISFTPIKKTYHITSSNNGIIYCNKQKFFSMTSYDSIYKTVKTMIHTNEISLITMVYPIISLSGEITNIEICNDIKLGKELSEPYNNIIHSKAYDIWWLENFM